MTPVLRVRNVGWRGTVPVLEHVSFDVGPGELVAVMGRNGAGKSTLLDIVAGLRTPAEGAVILRDRPVEAWNAIERARVLAHLPQQARPDLAIDAESLVLMGRYPHAGGWFESDADVAVAHAEMRRCACFEFRRRPLASLSGGERQRVFLAACLAQHAALLVLDEPATYLDVDQQLHCFGLLRAEADRGAACLAVTHDINLALTFCTRLIVLANRTIARDLDTRTALESPDWLRMFSERLTVSSGSQRPWVGYQ